MPRTLYNNGNVHMLLLDLSLTSHQQHPPHLFIIPNHKHQ